MIMLSHIVGVRSDLLQVIVKRFARALRRWLSRGARSATRRVAIADGQFIGLFENGWIIGCGHDGDR